MELLFVILGAAIIGLIPRYLLPGRDRYGSGLLPAVSATVAAILWASLTWLGWRFDGGWIWWVSLSAGGLAALFLPLIITPHRTQHDEKLLEKLLKN